MKSLSNRAIEKLGWTRKKSMRVTESNEEERTAWREKATSLSTDMLVFGIELHGSMGMAGECK